MEHFSNGYYKMNMTVQPVESGPVIEQGLYDFINREFYYQTNAPLTMRAGLSNNIHFRPNSEPAMPTDVLGLPKEMCDKMKVHPSSEDVDIFVLKPSHAYLFNSGDI